MVQAGWSRTISDDSMKRPKPAAGIKRSAVAANDPESAYSGIEIRKNNWRLVSLWKVIIVFLQKNNDPSFPLSKVSFLSLFVFLYTWYGYATPWMTRTIENIILGLVFLEDYCIPGVKSLKIVTFCDTCFSGGTKWKLRETHRRCQWWIVWKSPGKKSYPFTKMVLSRPSSISWKLIMFNLEIFRIEIFI